MVEYFYDFFSFQIKANIPQFVFIRVQMFSQQHTTLHGKVRN